MGKNARDYSDVTIKRLFGLSQNLCANPDCTSPTLILDDGTVIAEICHIEDANKGGRYRENMSDDARRAFENLILLCRNCHKRTNNIDLFSVDVLKLMKKQHENKQGNSKFEPTQKQLDLLFASFAYDLDYAHKIEWGVLQNIVEYILSKPQKSNLSDDEITKSENFTHIKAKVGLNFPTEQRKRFGDIFRYTTADKTAIDQFLANKCDEDPIQVDYLIEFIVSSFCDVKGVSIPSIKIEDVRHIEELAKRLIPKSKYNSPEYLSAARAMIIHSFEFCHIGKKTEQEEQNSKTLFD